MMLRLAPRTLLKSVVTERSIVRCYHHPPIKEFDMAGREIRTTNVDGVVFVSMADLIKAVEHESGTKTTLIRKLNRTLEHYEKEHRISRKSN